MRAAATALLVGRASQFQVRSGHIALADTLHSRICCTGGHIADTLHWRTLNVPLQTHCTGGHIADVARIRQQQLRALFCASAFVVSSSDPAAKALEDRSMREAA